MSFGIGPEAADVSRFIAMVAEQPPKAVGAPGIGAGFRYACVTDTRVAVQSRYVPGQSYHCLTMSRGR